MAENVQVGILMGSASDLPAMTAAGDVLDELNIGYEMRIMSAHRTPAEADEFASTAAGRGIKVLICGAGMAAHLAGAVAGRTPLPVIGVPLNSSLDGLDALLATVQMPPGVPVATVAIGKAGAKNAAWMAARIIGTGDAAVQQRVIDGFNAMADKVRAADAELQASRG
ncbi:MAG: 5-(carboxyamino)imidazole ribonucleotide mutase [Myxococcota bacterium]|mgnify:FL=1|nr:5-(carboxyamino)imidazole ribonucleotide mutase [Myxococcota bacterium]MEC9390867.1 5-(carboxyamino)imidazole ribonucleotide mutase [Myxococcota bacterium]